MPTITLNKTVFEKLVGKTLPLEELKDRISMLGTDLEKIEGNTIEVEVFPNRPDMLSEPGFARAFSSFIGVKTGLRKYPVKKSGLKVIIEESVKAVRPYTACALVKRLKFDEERIREIIQIQEKLHVTYGRNRQKMAIGIYPLEKVTFPVTYKAEKPEKIIFQPLEATRRMTAAQILSQHPAGREYGHLLAGCPAYPLFVDKRGEILSLPPIINSHSTGKVTPLTKDLFVECSGFDFPTLSSGLNIIVTALAEMGGEIYSLELAEGKEKKITPDLSPGKMRLDLSYINQRLGLSLTEKEAIHYLKRMGFGWEKRKVLVPPYRTDILHPIDLVEEVAIAYGYEKFIPEIPRVATLGGEDPLERFFQSVRLILIGLGLQEVKNYHLMTAEELNAKMGLKGELISLKKVVGDYHHLRHSLWPSLLKNLQENQHQEYPHNLFEIGRTFQPGGNKETGVQEKEKLGIVLCSEKADFTGIRQVGEALLLSLGLKVIVKESQHPSLIPGRAGEIWAEDKKVGTLGEIHPQVLVNWGLEMPVVGLEIGLQEIFKLTRNF